MTGELITDRRRIAFRYLRTWFVIDLLATFPTDYIVRGIEVRPCRLAPAAAFFQPLPPDLQRSHWTCTPYKR